MAEVTCPKCQTKSFMALSWDQEREVWQLPRCPECGQTLAMLLTPLELEDLKAATPKRKTSKKTRKEESFKKKAQEMIQGIKGGGLTSGSS